MRRAGTQSSQRFLCELCIFAGINEKTVLNKENCIFILSGLL